MDDDSESLWIVIPAYNEGEVLRNVVAGVTASYKNVVVVDDCSTDNTSAAACAGGAIVLRHPINLGQGAALETGIRYALLQEAKIIVTFDADGQHRVEDIAVLSKRLAETGADIVIGSRFLGQATGIPWLRRIVLRLAVIFTRITSGVSLTDAHNGFRLFTRYAAEKIHIGQNRMAHASEIIDKIGALGLSVAEAPVTILYTEYSLRKGQKLSNAINILSELFIARLNK